MFSKAHNILAINIYSTIVLLIILHIILGVAIKMINSKTNTNK